MSQAVLCNYPMSVQYINGSPHDPQKLVANYLSKQGISLETDDLIPVIIYNPEKDTIITASPSLYNSYDEYYNELFIELIQSTSHPSRVGIVQHHIEGDQQYIESEFIGVLGACMLSSITGISKNALKHYVTRAFKQFIQENPSMITLAVCQAEKAVELIMKGDIA